MSQPDDRIYRWTIRSLYVTALVLNAWVLWDQVKDSPEGQALSLRFSTMTEKVTGPIRERRLFRKAANAVVYEAVTIVDESPPSQDTEE